MLKHCSPSSVDIRRRSRKNLDKINDSELNVDKISNVDIESVSSNSSNVITDLDAVQVQVVSSPVKIESPSQIANPVGVRDASTSPLLSGQSRKGRIPLAVLAKRRIGAKNAPSSAPVRRVAIKVYAKCLRSDIEYKTLSVNSDATAKEVIWMLLSKFRMKHRDPKLFYLTMDISIKRTGIPLRRSLSLDDDSRPVDLKSCHPWGDCKFTLQMRKGGVVRIYDSVLMAESKYKCLLVSEATTVQEVIQMLFRCYGLNEIDSRIGDFCIFEVNPSLRPGGE